MAEGSSAPRSGGGGRGGRGGVTRYDSMPLPLKIIFIVLITSALAMFVFHLFSWSIQGWILETALYNYLLFAALAPCVFLMLPARRRGRGGVRWFDIVLAAAVFASYIYFAFNYWEINRVGWVPAPDTFKLILAFLVGVLAIEGGRRMAGPMFATLGVLLFIYPLIAEWLPGMFFGLAFPPDVLISMYAFSSQGVNGVPARVMGEILVGFLMFAGMLIASGATDFFLNLALALVGRTRGGPAKVAVLASGFFGSLSGSPMANVASTGAVTIPAMKRSGYPPHYAGAIEAVASSGGVIMPPIMGGLAFVMSAITDTPYAVIMIAAFLPAILYYFGLLVQVDSYAARVGLRGLRKEEIPNLWKTLKEGWPFLFVMVFLVFGLIYMRWGVASPVYAAGLMLLLPYFLGVLSLFIPFLRPFRSMMMTPRKLVGALATIGGLVVLIAAIMFVVGFIVLGVQSTGAFVAITTSIMGGGESLVVVLLILVVTCYVFGMIGVAMPIYIVLAVTIIPAIVGGTTLNFLAVHLFVIYYINMQGITPPVCNVAFLGAAMAGAPPMKTGFTAMRLGVVLIFLPFFFLFNPALILQGAFSDTVVLFVQALVGIWILASGLEGYLLRVGRLSFWSRPLLVVGGFLIAFPNWWTSIIGVAMTVGGIFIILGLKRAMAMRT